MPGDCQVAMVSGVPVVTAPPEIDIASTGQLRTALLETMAHGHAMFVVDMSATRFCDSAGVQELMRAHKRARAEGGEARLVIASTAVRRVFTITGVDQVVPIFTTVRDAVAAAPATTTTRRGGMTGRRRSR
jgi:anti-sigma B factor antagonist